jgi:hypothetical protein
MSLVAFRFRPSLHAAYLAERGRLGVSFKALCDKLARMEPGLVAALVEQSGRQAAGLVDALPEASTRPPVPGYETRIIDGNHLTATEHRLKPLRSTKQGPLPGQCLAVLDPARGLVVGLVPCEDGHAQECSLAAAALPAVEPGQLWIADRNFCSTGFLFGVLRRGGFFLARQHASHLRCRLVGRRSARGRCATGRVYEQRMLVHDGAETVAARRVTLALDEPTRDGETELHLVTNLPGDVGAAAVAEAYRKRWLVEGAFGELTVTLRCEVRTLGYPKAALFAFAVAVLAYNALAAAKAALRSAHGAAAIDGRLSERQMTADVACVYEGAAALVPERAWNVFRGGVAEAAALLAAVARRIDPARYPKRPRGPKKPRPPRRSGKASHHVSTARLLAAVQAERRP